MTTTERRLSALANNTAIEVTAQIELEGATLVLFTFNDIEESSAIVYEDGTLMHLRDWQSGRPETLEEIANFDWVSESGEEAVVLNELPRMHTKQNNQRASPVIGFALTL